MAVEALVNRIIPFSSVDGPGNRTAVFLQGCNFNCLYCHNPETIRLCADCGACVAACPAGALTWAEGEEDLSNVRHADEAERHGRRIRNGFVRYDITKCVLCDTCIHVCPHGSSPRIRRMNAEEVMENVRRQIPYIRGITVSGGECTRQRDFLVELFALAHAEGLDCLLDSNGSLDFAKDPVLTECTDGVMLDVKAYDPAEHIRVTGTDNDMVLQNARYLASVGKLPEVRTVVVPGLFHAEDTIRNTARMLRPYLAVAPIRYKLIRFRPMGVRPEYAGFSTPGMDEMEGYRRLVEELGFSAVIA